MKGHEMIDIEVVHRWDDASLKMLYSHYYKALVAFSAQMVEHQEAAEELVQDAFVSLWQQRNTFQSAATLRAYLYNTVRNKSISWLRHERVERSRIEAFERDYRHSIEGFLEERAARWVESWASVQGDSSVSVAVAILSCMLAKPASSSMRLYTLYLCNSSSPSICARAICSFSSSILF